MEVKDWIEEKKKNDNRRRAACSFNTEGCRVRPWTIFSLCWQNRAHWTLTEMWGIHSAWRSQCAVCEIKSDSEVLTPRWCCRFLVLRDWRPHPSSSQQGKMNYPSPVFISAALYSDRPFLLNQSFHRFRIYPDENKAAPHARGFQTELIKSALLIYLSLTHHCLYS